MGGNSSNTSKSDNNTYTDLPSPPLSAKTIRLAAKLEAEYPHRVREKISMRQCIHKYGKEGEEYFRKENQNQEPRDHIKYKTPVLGSGERLVRENGNYGFFSTVLEAYNYHWSLRTCVEDWWYTIIRKIAVAIDDNAQSSVVRDFFVSHEGKKTLSVNVGPSVYGVDYSWFLDQMTQQIAENIKVPSYIDLLKADYSTSTKTHVIVSEITAMASLQTYFEYEMMSRCGIPSLEMEGEEEDWTRMKSKFMQLKDLLKPIHKDIGLDDKWWKGVERICEKLIKTFNGKPDVRWWSHIFTFKSGWGSGARNTYDGWFISELLGLGSISGLSELKNGIVTVPMKITSPAGSEDSVFAAGIAGFEMFKENNSTWPSVKAAHGWTLMLELGSVYREDLTAWESKLLKGA